jgi:hypothetical protein
MDAGATIATDALSAGPSVGMDVEYETIIVDTPWQKRPAPRYRLGLDLMLAFMNTGAAGVGGLRNAGLSRFNAGTLPQVSFRDEDEFVIASTVDLGARLDLGAGLSKGAALAALRAHLVQHPEDAGQLQVVAQYEVAA